MNANELKDWAKKNSKFLKLKDGESAVCLLKNVKPMVKDSFGEEKNVVRYTLEFAGGEIKIFDNGSTYLAEAMADFIGKQIKLKRVGEGIKTKYEVEEATLKAWDE